MTFYKVTLTYDDHSIASFLALPDEAGTITLLNKTIKPTPLHQASYDSDGGITVCNPIVLHLGRWGSTPDLGALKSNIEEQGFEIEFWCNKDAQRRITSEMIKDHNTDIMLDHGHLSKLTHVGSRHGLQISAMIGLTFAAFDAIVNQRFDFNNLIVASLFSTLVLTILFLKNRNAKRFAQECNCRLVEATPPIQAITERMKSLLFQAIRIF